MAGIAALVARRGAIQGTTLIAPWGWGLASLAALAGCEAVIAALFGEGDAGWVVPVRFMAAVGSFTPAVALLGAKHPQDRPWQLIVLSLWVILTLPGAWALLLPGGDRIEVRDLEAWFLWLLIAVGALNGLPTRFWPSAVLVAAGQVCLLAPHLPLLHRDAGAAGALAGLGCLVSGWSLSAWGWPPCRANVRGWDRVWLDFRDRYGALWALRVAQRVNAASQALDGKMILGWSGLCSADDRAHPGQELPAEVERTFHSLLRRFVSRQWIAQRRDLERPRHQESTSDESRTVGIG